MLYSILDKNSFGVQLITQCGFVEFQICEALENLFKGSLLNRIIVQFVFSFQLIHHLKQEADRFVGPVNSQTSIVIIRFNHFDFGEFVSQRFNNPE